MRLPLIALTAAGLLLGMASSSSAEIAPPPLPALTAEQSAHLEQEMTNYRQEVEARIARSEVTQAEAQRLLAWRRWQLARQVAGLAPRPVDVVPVFAETDPQYVRPHDYGNPYADSRRYYYGGPYAYARPYYWQPPPYFSSPAPYYWGPRISICAGGFGRHAFGSLCF